MDKRRLIVFMVLATLILAVNQLIVVWLAPKPDPAIAQNEKAAQAQADKDHGDRAAGGKAKGDQAGDEKPGTKDADASAPEGASPDGPAAAKPEGEDQPAAEKAPETLLPVQRVSLGSFQPDSGYRLLVTLNNQGAAVERIELTSHQYRDLEDRSGYLGHLAPIDAPKGGGCLIQVVGRGTPAETVGLKPGDVITRLNSTTISTATDFVTAVAATEAEQKVSLEFTRDGDKKSVDVQLARRPIEMVRPELDTKPVDVADSPHDPLSMLVSLAQVDDKKLREADEEELDGAALRDATWELVESDVDHAIFRRQLKDLGVEVTKHYRLAKAPADDTSPDAPEYHLFLDVQLKNLANEKQTLAYRLDGPTGLPLEGAWYATKISRSWGAAGMRDVIVRFTGNKSPEQVSCLEIADKKKPNKTWLNTDAPLDYIAVDAQYFSAALVPQKADPKEVWFEDVVPCRVGEVPQEKIDAKKTDVSFRLKSLPVALAPQETFHHEFQLFAGPKKPAILEQYPAGNTNLGELVYYGLFGWVSEPMLALLHMFYLIVRNYGVAIVMLTVLVRGCMFPLSRKQAQSSQKMAELKPEMQRIQEKYKDPNQRNKALQELYRKHSFNPFGGCLLMFIQLPIFVGLYRSLSVDVELRQAPLISDAVHWCSNLAAPDMLWDWSQVMPNFVQSWLGPYLNVFPFFTIALFMWQQKMFMPPATDEQTAMQQKMMSYMTIFMGVLFYKVASGLCLYFIASSLWGIAERKALPQSSAAAAAAGAGPKRTGPEGGNGSPPGKRKQSGRK